MKHYISDLHFGHEKIIKLDGRPFENAEHMNNTIIDNWNNVVSNSDEVYILGDVFWKNELAVDILPKLNGEKHLIKGNHDKLTDFMKKHYTSINEYKRIKDEGRDLILCHYPIAHWDGQFHGSYHLYGHIHVTQDRAFMDFYKNKCMKNGLKFNSYNVGCMIEYMGYTPRTLDYIIENGY